MTSNSALNGVLNTRIKDEIYMLMAQSSKFLDFQLTNDMQEAYVQNQAVKLNIILTNNRSPGNVHKENTMTGNLKVFI